MRADAAPSLLLAANTDWFLFRFLKGLAQVARESGFSVRFASPPGEWVGQLQESGFAWDGFPMSRSTFFPPAEIATVRRMSSLYRETRPDVLHHSTLKCALYGSLAARRAGIPRIVNSITGLGYLWVSPSLRARSLRAVMQPFARRLLRHTETVFLNEEDRAEFLARRLVAAEHSHVLPGSGVDIAAFRPQARHGDRAPIVLFAGRLLRSKGVVELVEAAHSLRSDFPATRFVLVGVLDPGNPDSFEEADLRRWVDDGIVEWWGFRSDMPNVYAQADVVCLPSHREGAPTTLLEGAASGLPLVATDVPGCRTVVADGVNGHLVPVRRPAELATALRRLLGDGELRRSMGRASRERAEREFSEERIARRMIAIYRSLLS